MKEELFRKQLRLWLFCLCVVICAVPALSFAADAPDAELPTALRGRWEGTLTGAFRAQEVSWHFDVDESGALRGFMGPSSVGMPSLPMENLVISANRVSFAIGSQHGVFDGALSTNGIDGTWQQGSALPLQMRKKNFAFPLSPAVRAALAGRWDMVNEGAAIYVDFIEGEAGTLSGFLNIPSVNLYDMPLVDIFVTDEGYAQFATDNGRRFSGRLVNGALIGGYVNSGTQYRRSFVRAGQLERGFDLTLSVEAAQRVAGNWYYEIWGDDIVLEVTPMAQGRARARLLFDEGAERSDVLVELVVEGENVGFTTLGGRTFSGTFTDDGIAGEYRVNTRPYQADFSRNPN